MTNGIVLGMQTIVSTPSIEGIDLIYGLDYHYVVNKLEKEKVDIFITAENANNVEEIKEWKYAFIGDE